MTESLVAGRIGRPHGLDGSFHAVDADARLLGVGVEVEVGGRRMEIAGRKGTQERPILRLVQAPDREAIEALVGELMLVGREAAPALEPGEYWAEDLIGCAVLCGERELGRVERLLPYPSCELLEVGDLLVPMVRDAILSVDVTARRIEVDPAFLGLDADG